MWMKFWCRGCPMHPRSRRRCRCADRLSKIPLKFVRMQPLVSPKIELSDQRLERVDVRVLPIIFRIEMPKDMNLYPGLLVDVYIGE